MFKGFSRNIINGINQIFQKKLRRVSQFGKISHKLVDLPEQKMFLENPLAYSEF
jgi:hypothetical protein